MRTGWDRGGLRRPPGSLDPLRSEPGLRAVRAPGARPLGGPPDTFVDSAFQRELGVGRARAPRGRATFPSRPAAYRGRPVWRLSTPVRQDRLAGAGYSPDHLEVKVDVETGIPLYASLDGGREAPAEAGDPTAGRQRRRLAGRPDSRLPRRRRADPQRPGLPARRPRRGRGRRRLRAARPRVAARGLRARRRHGGAGGRRRPAPRRSTPSPPTSSPWSTGAASTGSCSRPGSRLDGDWSDPLATGEGFVDRPERIRLQRGALSGVEANLLIVPLALPHIWALTDDLVVTVAGDLNREQLLRVTESLEARR